MVFHIQTDKQTPVLFMLQHMIYKDIGDHRRGGQTVQVDSVLWYHAHLHLRSTCQLRYMIPIYHLLDLKHNISVCKCWHKAIWRDKWY